MHINYQEQGWHSNLNGLKENTPPVNLTETKFNNTVLI